MAPERLAAYFTNDELTARLKALAAAHPDLVELVEVGRSFEGRTIWALELTNKATGPARQKPAVYLEGNIHAGEVTGSAVCLYIAGYLLDRYGRDERVTALLDHKSFYILPRVNPDGAQLYLTTPRSLRSSVRPYPEDEEKDGLHAADVDGDGEILLMRVADPEGDFVVSAKDPRLMVKRGPKDRQGPFYRLYNEGFIRNHKGGAVKLAPPREGLDTNRNWPANWAPEHRQYGAGPYPLSEPETRAVAEYMMARRNIAVVNTYHTTVGMLLRPFSAKGDETMPQEDLACFNALGRRGEELTGYAYRATFAEFAHGNALHGDYQDWSYEHLGQFAWCTELWDVMTRAGLRRADGPRRRDEDEDLDLALLRWNDRELAGQGFVPWQPFEHPQLGRVEIGGWRRKFFLQNPPPALLPGEAYKNLLWVLELAEACPLLRLEGVTATPLGAGLYRLEATVKNGGFLPTGGTAMAGRAKAVKPPAVEVEAPGFQLVIGKGREVIADLPGVAAGALTSSYFGGSPDYVVETKLTWVLRREDGTGGGGRATVTIRSDRAGVARAAVDLPP
ncbi:MAG: M14 family metallopeptidase, partial [Bacillota bacterium]